jgi:hypothetical protein
MSDILDWLERLSELFILKLLTLGAWSKAYERYRTITFTEDYLHDQTIDELINIYGMIIDSYLHGQVSDESIVLTISPNFNSGSALRMFSTILGTPIA